MFYGSKSKLIAIGLLFVLVSCQLNKEVAGPPIVNGKWASADGVYTSEFSNGAFRSIANDTGNTLAEGSYIVRSETAVDLSWTSRLSGASNTAKCTKPSADVLNCNDATGNRFTLRRTSAL